jgi:hypothetical protein
VLPIPIGAYNYIYGASSVSAVNFLLGITLGSIKPYLFDCYLGLFGKSVLDREGSSEQDVVLAIFVGVILLVGTYASQVATNAWAEIQKEAAIEPEELQSGNSTSLWSIIGVDDSVVPKFVLDFQSELSEASDRVQRVIASEAEAVEFELRNGIDIGWDINNIQRNATAASAALDRYSYPGERNIYEFESLALDETTVVKYTYESILFSFILFGELLKDRSSSRMKQAQ